MTPDGVLFVDKAEGWTSHDAVARARRALGTRKVGHAGTLDPMATGLLVLGVGPSTRLLTHVVGLDKTYTATIRLGQSTVTDDREGEVMSAADAVAVAALTDARIAHAITELTGEIEQRPSSVSAIKVDGRRAYDRVRSGEDVQLRARPVTIHEFTVLSTRPDVAGVLDLDVLVRCSSGTYVRALARDLGASLGVGGHLTALRRTAVGPFALDGQEGAAHPVDAVTVSALADETPHLADPAAVAATLFPVLRLTSEQAIDLGHGKRLRVPETADAALCAALAPSGRLVGLVRVSAGDARVVTNFPQPSEEA